jgi:hypothetical protein
VSIFTPEWKVTIDGTEYTGDVIVGMTLTAGRTDIYSQPYASFCSFSLINFTNAIQPFDVNAGVSVEIKDSLGIYIPLFGGYITDNTNTIDISGANGYVTRNDIIALGNLGRLTRYISDGVLTSDLDGAQIRTLLEEYLTNQWNEVGATETWQNYDPTTTWANAENVGLGTIDAGQYTMINRSSSPSNIYDLCAQIANSALGYLYEDASGNVSYADAAHRQTYLAANGYTELDANQAYGIGLRAITRAGDVRNKLQINYGTNFGSQYTAQDLTSQELYGRLSENINSSIKNTSDAEDFADRFIELRAYPQPYFDQIRFPVTNPEIDDADRDALLGIFMGQPIRINNLPYNINAGQFEGYVEGWTFTSGVRSLDLSITVSPLIFSQIALRWNQVNAAEQWQTISATLEWEQATGAVA